ncbi:MAG TPA: DUF1439 domain-containing protein [Planctomycetota bacterium]|nr:DUF1439 domain-containing protein [Planctomycetota bacterium]
MKKLALLAGAALIGGLGWLGWTLWTGSLVVALGPRELQLALERSFPVETAYLHVLKIDLRDPVVSLAEGSDRIGLSLKLGLGMPPLPGRWAGSASISCRIRYNAALGAFFADDPLIERLEVADHPGRDQELTRTALTWVLKGVLEHTPVYTLAAGETSHVLAKLVLKDVRVRNGSLRLTLGLGQDPVKN